MITMNAELLYNSLIDELNKAFPEFPLYLGDARDTMDDNVPVYLTFFGVYACENWQNEALQSRVAAFIERLQDSPDESLQLVFDDFLLDLYLAYEEKGINIQSFLDLLNTTTRNRMVYNYNYWIEAMRKAERHNG